MRGGTFFEEAALRFGERGERLGGEEGGGVCEESWILLVDEDGRCGGLEHVRRG